MKKLREWLFRFRWLHRLFRTELNLLRTSEQLGKLVDRFVALESILAVCHLCGALLHVRHPGCRAFADSAGKIVHGCGACSHRLKSLGYKTPKPEEAAS